MYAPSLGAILTLTQPHAQSNCVRNNFGLLDLVARQLPVRLEVSNRFKSLMAFFVGFLIYRSTRFECVVASKPSTSSNCQHSHRSSSGINMVGVW